MNLNIFVSNVARTWGLSVEDVAEVFTKKISNDEKLKEQKLLRDNRLRRTLIRMQPLYDTLEILADVLGYQICWVPKDAKVTIEYPLTGDKKISSVLLEHIENSELAKMSQKKAEELENARCDKKLPKKRKAKKEEPSD